MTTTSTTTAPHSPASTDASRSRTRPRARPDLVSQPVGHLEAEVIDLATRLAAGTYELLVLVGELDHRGSWATSGALTCAAWLADTCDIEISTARTQVRVARTMRQYPALDAAMGSGDISYAKARVLASCLTEDNADALLDIAERTPAGRLGAAIAAWSQRNENPQDIRRRRHPTRRQRRVLDEIDNECAHPGCHARTFLQPEPVRWRRGSLDVRARRSCFRPSCSDTT